jgi:hypothetical protein
MSLHGNISNHVSLLLILSFYVFLLPPFLPLPPRSSLSLSLLPCLSSSFFCLIFDPSPFPFSLLPPFLSGLHSTVHNSIQHDISCFYRSADWLSWQCLSVWFTWELTASQCIIVLSYFHQVSRPHLWILFQSIKKVLDGSTASTWGTIQSNRKDPTLLHTFPWRGAKTQSFYQAYWVW